MRVSNSASLTALSPLDGRYSSQLCELAEVFSEAALIKQRVGVEVAYVLALAAQQIIPRLSKTHQHQLQQLADAFSLADAQRVKELERTTKHDVKAVEYFLRERCVQLQIPVAEFLHLGLTSEDVNALALALQLRQARQQVLLPKLVQVLDRLTALAAQHSATPMLARTHGQPAVPTTMGKELVVFVSRLEQELRQLALLPIEAKMNGAVGNYNAQVVAFPKVDWMQFSSNFITLLGLAPSAVTTQILPAENYCRLFNSLARCNSILIDLNQDLWRYISDGYFLQSVEPGQVGSSTMPQKINPIDFENSEGNLGLANALLNHFAAKLPISRLQRDLSDSTVKRSIGSALGYCLLGYQSVVRGLGKVTVNSARLEQELNEHWEVITEGLQVMLRAYGQVDAYEQLKNFSQGKQLTENSVKLFINSLAIDPTMRAQLLSLSPTTYLGLAKQLTLQEVTRITLSRKEWYDTKTA